MSNTKNIIDYEDGYRLTLANSDSLLKVSESAASQMEFGIANSLCILSAEEAVKSLFLLVKWYNPDANIKKFDKIFIDHKVKHEQLRLIVEVQDSIKKFIKAFHDSLIEVVKELETRYKAVGKEDDKILVSIREDMEWYKKESNRQVNFDKIFEWINEANSEKNKGLYVDIGKKGQWVTPKNVTIEKYNEGRKYRNAISEYILNIEEVFKKVKKPKTW